MSNQYNEEIQHIIWERIENMSVAELIDELDKIKISIEPILNKLHNKKWEEYPND
tara:strand:+ start:167 stop:331 length:165 start_codon:yes stop_codon:yes gene_type:complete